MILLHFRITRASKILIVYEEHLDPKILRAYEKVTLLAIKELVMQEV